mmetsp:Transcript_107526/g.219479  ORF Transcript_107526/g.219479 Transcript_107526/m.219479 type:complete len:94 (+) Transcript_107526:3276-3557(+)
MCRASSFGGGWYDGWRKSIPELDRLECLPGVACLRRLPRCEVSFGDPFGEYPMILNELGKAMQYKIGGNAMYLSILLEKIEKIRNSEGKGDAK